MSTQPRDEATPAIDWSDPSRRITFDEGGWSVTACEGDAPLLCVEKNGEPVGYVEAVAFPMASIDGVDPSGAPDANLRAFASGFLTALESDRAAGCGEDYGFEPIDAESMRVGGLPGVSFGYVGTMADGSPSELNLQYATIVAEAIVSITAIAYDDEGCPGRDDLSGFRSVDLVDFRPSLEELLRNSPLPPVG